MRDGAIESTVVPRNPLDVLASRSWRPRRAALERDELYAGEAGRQLRRAGRDSFEAVLSMLAGHYGADEFVELRPRIVWDRTAGTVESRRDARTSPSSRAGPFRTAACLVSISIPRRDGRRSSVDAGKGARSGGRRVGELDEEMVYETRAGEVILLGASAWRVDEITHDRVLVSPAPASRARSRSGREKVRAGPSSWVESWAPSPRSWPSRGGG
jgi:ATP-dependent Lhr-like helicase